MFSGRCPPFDELRKERHSFAPYASAGRQHEFISNDRSITAQFSAGGESFTVNTAGAPDNGALLGAGVDAGWGRLTTRLSYLGDIRSNFVVNTVDLTARGALLENAMTPLKPAVRHHLKADRFGRRERAIFIERK